MASDKFIWRRGDTFHFRRRLDSRISGSQTISISMKTRCPDRARIFARRLAARWDLEMTMLAQPLTNSLSPTQRSQILKNAMVEELGNVTMHLLTEPYFDPALEARRALRYATAFDDGRRDLGDPTSHPSRPKQSDGDEKLIDTIRDIYVCRETMEEISAPRELAKVGAAPTFANRHMASLLMLAGWAEARRRCSLLDHPALRGRADLDAALLDEDLIASIRLTGQETRQPMADDAAQPIASSPVTVLQPANDQDFPFKRRDERRFSEVIDDIIMKKRASGKWSTDKGDQLRILSIFCWVTGDKRLCDYRQSDIEIFQEAYELAPAGFRWMKHIKDPARPSWESVKAGFPNKKGTVRSAATHNRDVGIVQSVCRLLGAKGGAWERKTGKDLVLEVDERKDLEQSSPLNPKRMPWTPDQLNALFSLPIYTGGGGKLKRLQPSRMPNVWHDGAYWVPLLCAYSGAARGELCGLEITDVVLDCRVPHIWIKENMTRSKDGETPAGLKAAARYRHVPIHPELLRLGFADYVKAIVKGRHKQLFPEFYTIKTGGGERFYRRAWIYMADAVDAVTPLFRTSRGKRADFHSIRTYSESILSAVYANQAAIDRILGHVTVGTGGKDYNRRQLVIGIEAYLTELLELMVKSFPVVTAHLNPSPIKLLALNDRSCTGSA
jgi:integrase